MQIRGANVYLRRLTPQDVSDEYVRWMNDPNVVQFLESRFKSHSKEDLQDYVKVMNADDSNFLFGLYLNDTNQHIGNVKIGPVNQVHRHAGIGLIVGKKELWGKGLGREVISLATDYAFSSLNLNKLTTTIYASNTASYRAFSAADYTLVGTLKKHVFSKGVYEDCVFVERCRDN